MKMRTSFIGIGMRKTIRIVMAMLLSISVLSTWANPVDIRQAQVVAAKFAKANLNQRTTSSERILLGKVYSMSDGRSACYVFNLDPGFVIVAADDCAVPILGYSEDNRLDSDHIPIQMDVYIKGFVKQLQYGVEKGIAADPDVAAQWASIRQTGCINGQKADRSLGPLLSTQWDQGCYYNNKCPVDNNGDCGRVAVGCVATAMGQVLRYWGYPATGQGTHSYTPDGYATQTVNYGATTYNWNNMPNRLVSSSSSTQINAISTLLWHCGVGVEMKYGAEISWAYFDNVITALQDHFRFPLGMFADWRTDQDTWLALLKGCLNHNCPVYYTAQDDNDLGGHAFVCDGYDSNNYFHFNWGWSGEGDGYFALNALNLFGYEYNTDHYAIFNMAPDPIVLQQNVSASPSNGGNVSGSGSYYFGNTCTLNATANTGYSFVCWKKNGVQISTNPRFSFRVVDSDSYVAVFSPNSCNISASANPSAGGTVSGGGSYNYGSNCTLTAIPATGYSFVRWTKNGSQVSTNASYSFTVTENANYVAVFSLNSYTISASANPSAGGTVSGGGSYNYGSNCTLTATPATGYTFVKWTKNGSQVSTNASYSFTVTENANYVAVFSLNSYNISASANPSAGGIVSGGGTYNSGSTCTLTAMANTGYVFMNWTENSEVVSIEATYSFTVTEGRSLVANFIQKLSSLSDDFNDGVIDAALWTYRGSTVHEEEGLMKIEQNVTDDNVRLTTLPLSLTSIGQILMERRFKVHRTYSYFSGGLTVSFNSTGDSESGFSIHYYDENYINKHGVYFNATIDGQVTEAFLCDAVFDTWLIERVIVDTETGSLQYYLDDELVATVSIAGLASKEISCFNVKFWPYGWFTGHYQYMDYININTESLFSYTISAAANPADGGTIEGSGAYDIGSICTLTATPATVYTFSNWTENGEVVSTEASYSFTVTGNRNLVANFAVDEIINFADANVKALCVQNWDTNGDGELSYTEATAVTNLGDVFQYNGTITSFEELRFFTGLTSIGRMAFYGCGNLSSVCFPYSLTSIGEHAFTYSGLRAIDLPNSLVFIDAWAFSGCPLTTVVIPSSVHSIGTNPFINCSQLEQIIVDPENPVYDSRDDCNAIVQSNSNWLIVGCKNSIITNTIRQIGQMAFNGCTGLNSITIPNTITKIQGFAFMNCKGLQIISIPNTVNSIDVCAFLHCTRLTGELIIPNSVTTIGSQAFQGCSGITSLSLGSSVSSIGGSAFAECDGLKYVTALSDNPPTGTGSLPTSIPLYVPCTSVDSYQSGEGWSVFSTIIGLCDSGIITLTASPAGAASLVGEGTYESGTLCNVSASTNENYSFMYWTENEQIVSTNVDYSFMVTTDRNLVAYFSLPLNVNAIADPIEGGLIEGNGDYDYGETCTLMAMANEGYTFMYWTEDGNQVSTDTSYSFVVTTNRELVAHFASPFSITASVNLTEGGVINGMGEYDYNTTCTLTATANEGYSFIKWTKNGNVVSYVSPYCFTVTEGAEYVAFFEETPGVIVGTPESTNAFLPSNAVYNYTLSQQIYTPEEIGGNIVITNLSFFNTGGQKTRNYDIYMVHTDKNTFDNNTDWIAVMEADRVFSGNVTLLAAQWSTIVLDTPFAYNGTSNLAIVVDDNSGNFTYQPYMTCRIFNANGNQSIRVYSDNTNYDPMTPPSSYASGNYVAVQSVKNQILINTFVYNVSAATNISHAGSVSGTGSFGFGQTCILTATANDDYYFVNWTKNDSVVSTNANYSFIVTEDGDYVAHFAPRPVGLVTAMYDPDPNDSQSPNVRVCWTMDWSMQEDFETGNFGRHVWEFPDSYLWVITDHNPYEGGFCMRSNNNGVASSTASAQVTVFIPIDGQMSFYSRISSESRYDLGRFYIDSQEMGNWSGNGSWEQHTYDITAGEHTFKWIYSKDGSVNGYDDCFYVDNISFVNAARGGRAVNHYKVYRNEMANGETFELIADNITDTCFVDTDWSALNEGWYRYAVDANYSDANSASEYETIMIKSNRILRAYLRTITAIASPAEGGTVIGAGVYPFNDTCTVTATPNEGYTFIKWTKNGETVSYLSSYSFTVTENAEYVAHFEVTPGTNVGTPEATNLYLPSYSYYKYTLSQQIYTPDEIGVNGFISTIGYFNAGATKTRNYDIYMLHTDKTVFENNTDWITITEADRVFSGDVTMESGYWTTIVLDIPFAYDGTSNLAVIVDDNSGNYTGSPHMACRTFNTNGNQAIRVYSDGTNYDPYNPSGYNGTLHSEKNQVIFRILPIYHYISNGTWGNAANWSGGVLPGINDAVSIDANCALNKDAEVALLAITPGKTLTIRSGKTLTVTGTLANKATMGLVIKEGGQLINASGKVAATMEKGISAHDGASTGWYTIASPMNGMPIAGSDFVTPEYDLYRFNETNLTFEEWENYKSNHADFTTFEKGRGYLYANSNDFTSTFTGILNASPVTYSLTCTNRPNDPLGGFHLIGNPFPHEIYKGAGGAIDNANLASGYYTLDAEGIWQVHSFDDAILPGQSILVKATAPTTLTIAKSTEEAFAESGEAKMGRGMLRISVVGDNGQDRAYVYFGHGVDLDKANSLDQSALSLAIRKESGDFAIAHFDKKSDAIELVFTTPESGSVTLDVKADANDFEYLHMVDMFTGADIDLLQQSSYTFDVSGQAGGRHFMLRYNQLDK